MTSSSGSGPATPAAIPDLAPPAAGQWDAAIGSSPTTSTPSETSDSTKDVAKDQAASVAGGAADAAKDVAGTAKQQAGQVAGEAKKQVRDLVGQAQSELTDQAQVQQERVAGGLHEVSAQLRSLANGDAQQGMATDLAHQAADKVADLAGFFENRDPGQVLTEVKRYAQRNPGMFLALSLGAGILAGRLTRGLKAASDDATPAAGTAAPNPAAVDGPGLRPALDGTTTAAHPVTPAVTQAHWSAEPGAGR